MNDEALDQWTRSTKGLRVTQIRVGTALGLQLTAPAPGDRRFDDINLVGPFAYRAADGRVWRLGPDDPRPDWAPALAAFGLTVEHVAAQEGGGLVLAFSDGSALSGEPGAQYEAWQLWGPRDSLVVSIPGGDLAVWAGR